LVSSTPLPFVGITPCRQYDSRNSTVLVQNTARTVPLIGAPCGIPATAQAVALNITIFNIAGAASNGVFSVGITAPPPTAWINYPSTETQRGNAGVVGLTVAGEIVVQVNQTAGSVDFVVDVFGYYAPGATGSSLGLTGGANPVGISLNPFVPLSGYTFQNQENANSVLVSATCMADFLVRVDTATGGTTPILFALRVNGVDSAATCTLGTAALSCSSNTVSSGGSGVSASIAAGDLVTLHLTGPANYGAASLYWVGLKCQ